MLEVYKFSHLWTFKDMWIEELSFLTILICFQIYKVKTSISVNVAMNAMSRQIGRYCHTDWWICSSAHLLLVSCRAHFANLLWHYMGYNPGYREAKNCHLVMLLFLFWYFNPLFSGSRDKFFFAQRHISMWGVEGMHKTISFCTLPLFTWVMYTLYW